jgi:hypothetical protein
MYAPHDLLDNRLQSIGTDSLFMLWYYCNLFMLPYIYVSGTTDHIPDNETDMNLPWWCASKCCLILLSVNKLKKNMMLWILLLYYSWYEILEHVHLVENLSKIIINRYLFKWSRCPLKALFVCSTHLSEMFISSWKR